MTASPETVGFGLRTPSWDPEGCGAPGGEHRGLPGPLPSFLGLRSGPHTVLARSGRRGPGYGTRDTWGLEGGGPPGKASRSNPSDCVMHWAVASSSAMDGGRRGPERTSPGMVGGRVLRRSLPLTFPKTLTNQAGQRAYTEGGVNRRVPAP